MLLACRLMETRFSAASMDGEGARLFGGRWNSPGTLVVYTSGSLALAMLEVMVHLKNYSVLRADYSFVKLQIPDDLVEIFAPDQLPFEWTAEEPESASRKIGDAWIRSGRSAVLAVPSAVVPEEMNFLLNPAHPDFQRITAGILRPFRLDARLVR